MLVGRLVSIKIDICENIGEEVCVWGGGKRKKGRMLGEEKRGEIQRRGREVGGGEGEGRKGKGKKILMFRGQEKILNGGRVEI